jgi:hypothetical protein
MNRATRSRAHAGDGFGADQGRACAVRSKVEMQDHVWTNTVSSASKSPVRQAGSLTRSLLLPRAATTPSLMTLRTLTAKLLVHDSLATCLSYERKRKPRLAGQATVHTRGRGDATGSDNCPLSMAVHEHLPATDIPNSNDRHEASTSGVRQAGRAIPFIRIKRSGVRIPSGHLRARDTLGRHFRAPAFERAACDSIDEPEHRQRDPLPTRGGVRCATATRGPVDGTSGRRYGSLGQASRDCRAQPGAPPPGGAATS